MQREVLYSVTTKYATYGVVVNAETGRVTRAAPIARWMIGERWNEKCRRWLEGKGATVVTASGAVTR